MNTTNDKIQSPLSIRNAIANIQDFFSFLIRRWYILLLTGILGGLAGITFTWLAPEKFEAELTFTVEEDQNLPGGLMGFASSVGIDFGGGGGAFSGDNIIELLRSKTMMEKALLQPLGGKNNNYSLLNFYLDSVAKRKAPHKNSFTPTQQRTNYSRAEDSLLKASIVGITKTMLQVGKPDKKLSIIRLACVSGKEQFSKELVENLIEEVTRFYVATKTGRNKRNVDLLQMKADSLSRAISGNISYRAASTDANINPSLQVPTVGAQRSQYNIQVLTAAYSEVLKNLEMSKFNLLRETPLIQIIDKPYYPLDNKKKGKLYGAVIGGFLAGVLCVFVLYLIFAFKSLPTQDKQHLSS